MQQCSCCVQSRYRQHARYNIVIKPKSERDESNKDQSNESISDKSVCDNRLTLEVFDEKVKINKAKR